jgi:DNA polymerase-3 subunit chi
MTDAATRRTEIGFYQMMRRPLDVVLPKLLEKALAAGFRVRLKSDDPALLALLDALLWSYDAASFLPHSLDGDHAASQPLLLTGNVENTNAADLLTVVDGALPVELTAFARVLYLFDGNDLTALTLARGHWKAVREQPTLAPVFWKDGERGWEKAG